MSPNTEPEVELEKRKRKKKTAVLTVMKDVGRRGIDLTGFKSGRLTILGLYGKKVYASKAQVFVWNAKCSCGSRVKVNGQHFSNGNIKSCGCLAREATADAKRGNRIRRGTGTKVAPPMHLTPADMRNRPGDYRDFTGQTMGKLLIVSLSHGVLYWATNPRVKSKLAVQKHLVTHWNCLCSCGAQTVKSSSYLYKKGAYLACHKCVRAQDRNQPKIVHRKRETPVSMELNP